MIGAGERGTRGRGGEGRDGWGGVRVSGLEGYSLAFRTGCSQSVVMHSYTFIKGLAFRFRDGRLHSCPQGSEGVSVLKGSR